MPLGGLILSIIPVSAFLALLVLMDSFKLVTLWGVLRSLGVGAVTALVALYANSWLLDHAGVDLHHYRRYVGPVVEEIAKALWIVWLIRARRTGFMVDAAIHGFAVGAGFALVENVVYLRMLHDSSVFLWIVRGFGTAILHGSTTAIFATLAKSLSDRRGTTSLHVFLLPLLLAAVIHSLFNHFVLSPLATTGLLLVVMPLLFIVVFEHSERSTRRWIGSSFDSRMELLELILSGDLHATRIGTYLQSLRDRFPPVVVADMLCYLRIYSELSMRAKAVHIARQAGLRIEIGEDVRANLEELAYLRRSIGRTGRLALAPFLESSAHGLWEMQALRK